MDEEYDDYANIGDDKLEQKIERYERIQKSMAKMIAPSESDFIANYRVHRIVFENILVNPENIPEGNDRSLSIPFDGKMRPVWAPNGYGKTFAFKLLSFLHVDPNEVWGAPETDEPAEIFWANFIQQCKQMLDTQEESISVTNVYDIPIEKFKKSFNESKPQIFKNELVPFVSMKIRLVGTAKNIDDQAEKKVVDISLVPSWRDGGFTIDNKFWSSESLDSLFFQKFADEELKSILIDESGNSELSFRDPVFLKNSFIFPKYTIDFNHFYETNDLLNHFQEDNETLQDTITQNQFILEQLEIYIADLLTETGEYYSGKKYGRFSSEELNTLMKLKDFYQLKKNEKEKLLLGFMELNDTYPSFISESDSDDQISKNPLAVLDDDNQYNLPDPDFLKICTLLDLNINGVADYLRFNLQLVPYKNTQFGIKNEVFDSGHPNTWSSWRTFSYPSFFHFHDYDSEINSKLKIEYESIMEAVRMLSTCYFEIPSLINYSSESNFSISQSTMKYMLKSIQREIAEITPSLLEPLSHTEFSAITNDRDNFALEVCLKFLKIISQRLGGGRSNNRGSVLDNFFRELGIDIKNSYDRVLNNLESYYLGEETGMISSDPNELLIPDFTNPIWTNVVTKIMIFTEIYENINEILDSVNTTSWSAKCRFGSLENSMRFSDPSNDFEIKQEHLSFGQRSVIVSEVCLGFSVFLDPKVGLLNYSSSKSPLFRPLADIQCNFIIDEPEIGRSEYWVNEVAKRIIETSNYLEENKSIMIISHRESLLRSFNSDNMFYVMQPQESHNQEEE